ncbi:hypothetical protein RCO48_17495 [Peribacillus frigoritolerans]|nr:hypothetical protein [Peribacillus frigoritolerans]
MISFESPVTGVISYGYSNYRVVTDKAQLPALKDGGTDRESDIFREGC